MDLARTFRIEAVPSTLLDRLDAREAVIWVTDSFVSDAGVEAAAQLLSLPWRLVLCESRDEALLSRLEAAESAGDLLVRRRGFVQLIDGNPADVPLPPRSLPIYLLNGRPPSSPLGLAALTRRLAMLDALRRLQPRELVVACGSSSPLPPELAELWDEGLRTFLTIVGESPELSGQIEEWRSARSFGTSASYLYQNAAHFCAALFSQYVDERKHDRAAIRFRGLSGQSYTLDVAGLDNPEHPILANYEILQERDLRSLPADELSVSEVQGFFANTSISWRPYAAGMPWPYDGTAWQTLRARLRRLDRDGADFSRITYINAESGSGGTTLMRHLAWTAAAEGYPTLVARVTPFAPKALELTTFITRILEAQRTVRPEIEGDRKYEVPWLIVFDRMHWEGRSDELRPFLKEFIRSGRPVCIVVVTGPYRGLDFFDSNSFVELAALSHQVEQEDVLSLGRHINRYLRPHGPVRSESEWRNFYATSAVQAESGIAAFWIALSFWVQRQFDMNETVQSWIYRQFKETELAPEVRRAILNIAAVSSERYPLPESMLPPAIDWPVSQKLEDIRRDVSALGLARITREGDSYWLMAHDIIGRYLLTALYYDRGMLDAVGFGDALNPEHLRFLILRDLSRLPALGQASNRVMAEEFAISIFKIDPAHGHANFAPYWREVLSALDEMPSSVRMGSRSIRHHASISRRRVAKLKEEFPMGANERTALLERAISDIRYAIEVIPQSSDGETDLNLYNSLSHAYQDLEEEEIALGANEERIAELRTLGHEATMRAYRLNPDNSFVVETYARSLLNDARAFPNRAAENAIEALNLVYSAMDRDKSGQRRASLGRLAETAVSLLLTKAKDATAREPSNEIEALVLAIQALALGVKRVEGMELRDFPANKRIRAAELLAAPILQGNAQAVRLRYSLLCLDAPHAFREQLELLESLQDGGTVFTPQMRLELGLLFQQCDRHHDAQRLFRGLRRLWKEGEHYVEVPQRLRWLLSPHSQARRQVTGRVMSGSENRRMAKVRELQDTEVPFRPEEFGLPDMHPGSPIRGLISFGHNGPFLRPTTASPD